MKNHGDIKRKDYILSRLQPNEWILTEDIVEKTANRYSKSSQITVVRDINDLIGEGLVEKSGKGKATRYKLTPAFNLIQKVNLSQYFRLSQEKRVILPTFNFEIFELLKSSVIFTDRELKMLNSLLLEYKSEFSKLSPTIRRKEFERVMIELSWKSSVIEGNTYSLLETETLLKEGVEAKGKTKSESIMLLNHKQALEFVIEQSKKFKNIKISSIEMVHSILTRDLNITKGLRKTLVGITGTQFKPIDNEFQIKDSLYEMCQVLNCTENVFIKAFLSILLISYIQPFEDGNKRTGRIVGNAILLANQAFPLSFRSVDENEYKKATLLFYETNNLSAFKRIFIEQAEFAVKNYFRSKI